MRRQRKAIAGAVIGASLLVAPHAAHAQGTRALTVAASLQKEVITQHEPVIVDFTITNSPLESEDAIFDPGYDYERIDVRVVDTEGRTWLKPGRGRWQGTKFSEAVHVAPGRTGVSSIVLNDWINFDKVGMYQINVSVSSLSNSPSAEVQVPDTPLKLTVLPRDEASLTSACAALATRLENSKSFVEARTAAEALSKVDDPAAVPFLAEAVKRKGFEAMMIAALARLNTPDAVNVLVSASRSSDAETSRLAHAALVVLGKIEPPR